MATSDPREAFDPRRLDKSTIALPLLERMHAARRAAEKNVPMDVIIDVNLDYCLGREAARESIHASIEEAIGKAPGDKLRGALGPPDERIHKKKSSATNQYVFARLRGATILALVESDKRKAAELSAKRSPDAPAKGKARPGTPKVAADCRAIYRLWPDFEIEAHCTKSIATVKADAAQRSFSAQGEGIVWAVVDSGIWGKHPHFTEHSNVVKLPSPLEHLDFSNEEEPRPLEDDFGHGTHVAGIIAGAGKKGRTLAATRRKDDDDDPSSVVYEQHDVQGIQGMAPKCKLLSMKVLDGEGRGKVSNIIAALAKIQELNSHGRRILIHGVNLSVGYGFDAEWFACGQSPLCVEVDRLVKSGVVVVAAAGNTGYGVVTSSARGDVKTGMDLTINDPGNAELAITVGSTHRDMPHVYGVSYFSSKGPTGDGRAKPDLVAPGEKIISCAAGKKRDAAEGGLDGRTPEYVEDSGTSMAAPHVSGVIAALLSIRREFIGSAERVKAIVTSTATDLKRDPYFQGGGLVDLMRAIQSV